MEAVSFDNLSTQNLLPQVEADGPGKKKAAKEKAESSINIGKALQKEKDKQVEEAKVHLLQRAAAKEEYEMEVKRAMITRMELLKSKHKLTGPAWKIPSVKEDLVVVQSACKAFEDQASIIKGEDLLTSLFAGIAKA